MSAGLNSKVRIWRTNYQTDDRVGGAVISGTPLYDSLDARIEPDEPNSLLLQQGIEVDYTYTIFVRPVTLVIKEQDEVEVTAPYNHPELASRFLVRAVRRTSIHPADSRSFLKLTTSKRKYSHVS